LEKRAGGTVEREEDGLPCSGAEEMSAAERRRDGEGDAVESTVAEAVLRSAVVESYRDAAVMCVFSFFLKRLETSG
jgi:hypothetical protein